MQLQEFRQKVIEWLSVKFSENESRFFANELFRHFMKIEKQDFVFHQDKIVMEEDEIVIENAVIKLQEDEPIQYIVQEAFFYNHAFFVDENVLIPRPETEELVDWVVKDWKGKSDLKIVDIGTGSGCIPISIDAALPNNHVEAVEISSEAVAVATKNNENLNTNVKFHCLDILNEEEWSCLDSFDVIVSNPPYIPHQEKELMLKNVLDFEPHLALFVENDNALIFYEKMADFALQKLAKNGNLYYECNEFNAKEVCEMLEQKGFSGIELRKDMSGKDRMIKAQLH